MSEEFMNQNQAPIQQPTPVGNGFPTPNMQQAPVNNSYPAPNVPQAPVTNGYPASNIQQTPVTNGFPVTDTQQAPAKSKKKLTKKHRTILVGALVAIIVIAIGIFNATEFERVKDKAVNIAGRVAGSGNYFSIDTYPDEYDNMSPAVRESLRDDTQRDALEAIQYVNEALGFDSTVYSRMMKTTALMGRQYAENDKYSVSWTYHPSDGLEVTYTKK